MKKIVLASLMIVSCMHSMSEQTTTSSSASDSDVEQLFSFQGKSELKPTAVTLDSEDERTLSSSCELILRRGEYWEKTVAVIHHGEEAADGMCGSFRQYSDGRNSTQYNDVQSMNNYLFIAALCLAQKERVPFATPEECLRAIDKMGQRQQRKSPCEKLSCSLL